MLTMDRARHLAEDWVAAWNRRSLNAIMAHYDDQIEFYSPLIAERLSIASGRLDGKAALRNYFAGGLAALPDLHFELETVLLGMGSFVIYYRRETGAMVAEMTVVNDLEKAVRVRVHYTL